MQAVTTIGLDIAKSVFQVHGRVARPGSCGACRRDAAAKPAGGYVRVPRDHRVPLFRVWSEYRHAPWPQLLDYWGLPNLQAINRDVHAAKCAAEARDRYAARHPVPELA